MDIDINSSCYVHPLFAHIMQGTYWKVINKYWQFKKIIK